MDVFLPLWGEEDRINSLFWSKKQRGGGLLWQLIGLWQDLSITAGGASHHQDLLGSPIYFQVMEGKPGVSDDHCLLPKVCDSKVGPLGVTSKVKGDVDFCD